MRKTGNRSKSQQNSEMPRPLQFAFLCGLLMLVFYMWGRVQIDSVLKEKIKLERKKEQLLVRKNNLTVERDRLKSLGNIAEQMAARGLRSVPPSMQSTLVVDFDQIDIIIDDILKNEQTVNYAGFHLPGR